jgi:SpoVK/Ycf46/Vps4 family AAA+-type ATPase
LIRLDLGALKSKFVGESEQNIRKAQKVIEAIGRCVVWLDEIEKALQGAVSGSADGGTSADQLGALLSWMQERTSEAFVIATANDVAALPPELLRKGRFDECFFVDLPNEDERLAILNTALKAHRRTLPFSPELARVASVDCKDFTGSEISATVAEAMFAAFADGGREITPVDLAEAAAAIVPLATTAAPKIAALREWAKGKARPASAAKAVPAELRIRALDI